MQSETMQKNASEGSSERPMRLKRLLVFDSLPDTSKLPVVSLPALAAAASAAAGPQRILE